MVNKSKRVSRQFICIGEGFSKINRHARVILSLLPSIGVIIFLFFGGLILAGVQSLGYFPAGGMRQVSLDAYRSLFTRPGFVNSLWLTIWVSLSVTILSSVLAIASALLFRRFLCNSESRPAWLIMLYQLNLAIPHAIGAISILLLLSQSGLIARLVYAIHLIDSPTDFPKLVFDRYGIGIILAYLWKTTVFTGVVLLAALESTSDEYEEAARCLGANAFQRFRYIILPSLKPALVSTSVLVFAFTFGGYEVPYLLGQRSNSLLPVLAYREYSRVDLAARPEAMAISLLITLITSWTVWLYMRFMEREGKDFS